MKKSAHIVLATGLLLITVFIGQGLCQNLQNPTQIKTYSAIIDDTIAKCRNKIALLDSKSPNLRRQAMRASLKGAYLKIYKNELIAYLVSVNADPSPHRVAYHLNKFFYQSLEPDKLYVLMEASHMLTHSK